MLDEVATVMPLALRRLLVARLTKHKVAIYTGVECREATRTGVRFVSREKQQVTVEADAVVVAVGGKPDTSLHDQLRDAPFKVISAGDCIQPRGIAEAMEEGFRAGMAV